MVTQENVKATLKWFNPEKGFGFVAASDGAGDVFLHISAVQGIDPNSLKPGATLTVDLENQEIRGPDGGKVKFDIDPFRKHCLLNGLDDIGLTMEKKKSIDIYESKLVESRPWA